MAHGSLPATVARARALALLALAATGVLADPPPDPQVPAGRGPLDGMTFSGEFAPSEGPGGGIIDTLHFDDGHFWSEACVPCGFRPAHYWVRRGPRGIRFRGEMRSPDSGRFEVVGIVRDGRLSATLQWYRERWYWSIERAFRFEGTLQAEGPGDDAFASARAKAAAARASGAGCRPGP